jgi:transcriptional regulator with XRE-family HTH domain
VDDQAIGIRIRAARIRRGWRQADLAAKAGVSASQVSRTERGHLDEMTLAALRRIAAALEIRIDLSARSRAADLDRVVSARHAALAEEVLARLRTYAGWMARAEVTFASYGERGVVDIVAWHQPSRSLLLIELKTELVDIGEAIGTFDRKRRLASTIAQSVGLEWRPARVGAWLVVAEGATTRRRIRAHALTFRSAFPANGATLRRWLSEPSGDVAALSVVANNRSGTVRTAFAQPRRVRRTTSCVRGAGTGRATDPSRG